MKAIIMFSMFVGSLAGSYLPVLWGGSLFSMTSILLGVVGGAAGVFGGWKIATALGME